MSKTTAAVASTVRTVDLEEGARLIGVSSWTLRHWIRRNRYPSLFFRLGGRWRVRVDVAEALATGRD